MMEEGARCQTGFADYLDLLRVFDEREAEALIVGGRNIIKVARAHGFVLLQTMPFADLKRSHLPKLINFVSKRLPGWQRSLARPEII